MKKNAVVIVLLLCLCCAGMALVEAVLRPGYVLKSLCKLLLFGGSILVYQLLCRDKALKAIFAPAPLKQALVLGPGVYALILGGFFLLRPHLDLTAISRALLEKEKITAGNFLFVALYISLCNSFLEELLFRGLGYLTLRRFWGEKAAMIFSAAAFAVYHVFILTGWFSLWLFLLTLAGLLISGFLFNVLDHRGSLFPSWLVHGSANLAINTVGLLMFGLI